MCMKHLAVKLFALNTGESDDAFMVMRKVDTFTPIDFNWPSGPSWAAFFLLLIKAMMGSLTLPSESLLLPLDYK